MIEDQLGIGFYEWRNLKHTPEGTHKDSFDFFESWGRNTGPDGECVSQLTSDYSFEGTRFLLFWHYSIAEKWLVLNVGSYWNGKGVLNILALGQPSVKDHLWMKSSCRLTGALNGVSFFWKLRWTTTLSQWFRVSFRGTIYGESRKGKLSILLCWWDSIPGYCFSLIAWRWDEAQLTPASCYVPNQKRYAIREP